MKALGKTPEPSSGAGSALERPERDWTNTDIADAADAQRDREWWRQSDDIEAEIAQSELEQQP